MPGGNPIEGKDPVVEVIAGRHAGPGRRYLSGCQGCERFVGSP
jgi:hypothetical protein